MKVHNQKQLWDDERAYISGQSSTAQSITEESQDRKDSNRDETWMQEAKHKPWKSDACWLVQPTFLQQPGYTSKDGATHNGLDP